MSKFNVGDVCVVNEYSNNTEAAIVVVEKTHGTLIQVVDDTPGFWIFADYKLDLLSTAAEMEPEETGDYNHWLGKWQDAQKKPLTCGECALYKSIDSRIGRCKKLAGYQTPRSKCRINKVLERFQKMIAARDEANRKARGK